MHVILHFIVDIAMGRVRTLFTALLMIMSMSSYAPKEPLTKRLGGMGDTSPIARLHWTWLEYRIDPQKHFVEYRAQQESVDKEIVTIRPVASGRRWVLAKEKLTSRRHISWRTTSYRSIKVIAKKSIVAGEERAHSDAGCHVHGNE